MWNRLVRLFRSIVGFFIRSAEDPELLLGQLMDDMRDRIPKMNRDVASIISYVKQLEMKRESLNLALTRLKPMIETAVKAGESKRDVAMSLISEQQIKTREIEDMDVAIDQAQKNADAALKAKVAYEAKIRQRINECQRQVSRSKMATVQSEMAELMGSFQVGDENDTLERVTEKIDEKMALAQAKQEVSETSVENQLVDVEAEVAETQADEVYREYQRSLGIVEAPLSEKSMGAVEGDVQWYQPENTQKV